MQSNAAEQDQAVADRPMTAASESSQPHELAVPADVLEQGYWYVLDVIVNKDSLTGGTVVLAMDYREEMVELNADWVADEAGIEPVSASLEVDATDATGVAIAEDDPEMQRLLETILTKGAPQWKAEVQARLEKMTADGSSGEAETKQAEPTEEPLPDLPGENVEPAASQGNSLSHLFAGGHTEPAAAPEPEEPAESEPAANDAPAAEAAQPEPETPTMTSTDNDDRIVLRQPRGRDVAFHGEKIGCVSLNATVGESVKLLVKETNLYRTQAGRFVIEEIHGSAPELGSTIEVPGMDRRQITVCETQDEVIDRLGNDWMAKELYWQSGIEDVEIIE